MQTLQIESLDWNKQDGLIPAIVQDARSLRVLMLGDMNREALSQTQQTGEVCFFSRSRQRLWTKGESSGHTLDLVSLQHDCDNDTILVLANPQGPTCHLGRTSCFPDAPGTDVAHESEILFLAELDALIAQRERERPSESYTTRLFESGLRRMAQKVGEEGVETSLAAVTQEDPELLGEAADLVYHLAVLMCARGLSLADVARVLKDRHAC
jgi:phosphoribosyl-ATP pyrophosphohydrolase/phosphoribosyl-AMP cyclohydrolase